MSRSDRWCFTVPNPGEWRPIWTPSSMSYLVWEMETCPTTGTLHIQGYMRLTTRRRLQSAKDLLVEGAHLELSRGSEEENRNYCLKEFNQNPQIEHEEHGEYDPGRRQGRRSDLEAAIETLRTAGLEAVQREHPAVYVRNHIGLEKLQESLVPTPPLLRTMNVTVLWGAPGVGKTWRVLMTFPEAYRVRPGRDPWGTYNHEETILFDEFDYDKWRIEEMNELVDIYRLRLDCRYRDKWAHWRRVFIISNISPDYWWQYQNEVKKQAFRRRITNCIEVVSQEQVIDLREITQIIEQDEIF